MKVALLFVGAITFGGCRGIPLDLPPGSLDRPVTTRVPESAQPATLRVQVLSSGGQPVPNARVTASSPSHPVRSAVTDAGGIAVFWDVHPGSWKVVVQQDGYAEPAPVSVSVEPDSVAYRSVKVTASP